MSLPFVLWLPQVLCGDWSKYNDCIVATGSVDKTVRVWDVRRPGQELITLLGHTCVTPHSAKQQVNGRVRMAA
jgi:WD40 repeat protein